VAGSDPKPRPGRPRPQRSTVRRELLFGELLDKAAALFAERGYEATSLQDIATAVGISRPALYHYVTGKEDLLTALVRQASEAPDEAITQIAHRLDVSPLEKVRLLTQLLVRVRATSPGHFRILDRADAVLPTDIREKHLEARRHTLSELTAVIADGINRGDFKAIDPGLAALAVVGMCNWVAWWYRPGRGYDIDTVVDQLAQSAVDMLGAVPGSNAPPDSVASALERVRRELDTAAALLTNGRPER
jgi:AcrR family transcriptional regulator